MELYGGMDLHSTNTYSAIMDETRKGVIDRRLPNQPKVILDFLEPYRADLKGIVIESTYNWYWLVDLLQENGYRVHLANPSAIQQYSGLKHVDDRHDAFWLADLLRLGLLREGYIYPKEIRPIRDLLRKRAHLGRLRTSLLLSAQNIVLRNQAIKVASEDIKKLTTDLLTPHLQESEGLLLTGKISKELIDAFTRQIKVIETWVMNRLQPDKLFLNLLTIPGVGEILAMTILLETGCIARFPKVVTTCLTVVWSPANGPVMTSSKAKAMTAMGINIWPGLSQRQPNMPGATTRCVDLSITGNSTKRMRPWPTVP